MWNNFKARYEASQIQRKLDSSLETVLSPSGLSNLRKVYCNRRRILPRERRRRRKIELVSTVQPDRQVYVNSGTICCRWSQHCYLFSRIHVAHICICIIYMYIYIYNTSILQSFSR